MAPISKLLSGWLCGIGHDSNDQPRAPHESTHASHPLSGDSRLDQPPTPPHELPALAFAPPLTSPELSGGQRTGAHAGEPGLALPSTSSLSGSGVVGTLPPPAAVPPKLAKLRQVEQPTLLHSVTPPTPIDPTPSSSSTKRSPSSTSTHPSTPPSSTHSSEPATNTATGSPHLVPPAPHTLAVADPRSRSPGRGERRHHRRSSSQGTTGSRSFRETLNAYAVEGPDGLRSVNQYVLGETLGRGSYATVEKAVDRETGGEYAIKEFSKRRLRQIAATEAQRRERLANRTGGRGRGRGRGRGGGGAAMQTRLSAEDLDAAGPDNLDLVKTEVAIMKKVDHPNLASVHEVIDVTSDDALLMMELCHGGPILKVRDGEQATPYSEDEARSIFRQLVLGLAYLHHNQIIHRDIKPDNALFADSLHQHVKLVDFGVSKFAAGAAPGLEEHGVAGSPAYMAPELLHSDGGTSAAEREREERARTPEEANAVGYACDVWSLGVTLYALVVGRLPFQSSDPTEMFRQIRQDEPDIPSTLSPELRHLLTSLLDKSPQSRPTIPSLWSDPWLTASGPLPSYESNVASPIADPSSDEVDHALAVYRGSAFLAMSAAAKFKGLLSAAAVRRASSAASVTPPTSPLAPGQVAGGVMVDSPELVASPFASPSPSPSPSASRVQQRQPGAQARMRQAPREQTTMSSLSLASGAGAGPGADEEGEEEQEGGRGRARSGSPTPRPPSPSAKVNGAVDSAVVYGGAAELSASMAAAGVTRPKLRGVEDGEAEGEWEEPE